MISPAEVEIQVWKIGIEPHKKMWFNRQNRNVNSKKGFQLSTSFNQRQYGYAEGILKYSLADLQGLEIWGHALHAHSIQILGQLGATTRKSSLVKLICWVSCWSIQCLDISPTFGVISECEQPTSILASAKENAMMQEWQIKMEDAVW